MYLVIFFPALKWVLSWISFCSSDYADHSE